MADEEFNSYKNVRSLVKGLRIIEALNELGWSKISQLSAAADIQRTTTYRLVNTLEKLGYVTRRNEDSAIALAPKVAYLADGLRHDDIVTQFAWPPLFELTRDVLWPCDFATFEAGKVLIRLTTHKISPMSIHRGMIGKERHLFRTALGQAILSGMTPEQLDASLTLVASMGGQNAEDSRDRDSVYRALDNIRKRGFASSTGQTESKISAIALPVLAAPDRVVGAVNIVFFRSVMTTDQAAERYLDKLRNCVAQIERSLDEFEQRSEIHEGH